MEMTVEPRVMNKLRAVSSWALGANRRRIYRNLQTLLEETHQARGEGGETVTGTTMWRGVVVRIDHAAHPHFSHSSGSTGRCACLSPVHASPESTSSVASETVTSLKSPPLAPGSAAAPAATRALP